MTVQLAMGRLADAIEKITDNVQDAFLDHHDECPVEDGDESDPPPHPDCGRCQEQASIDELYSALEAVKAMIST